MVSTITLDFSDLHLLTNDIFYPHYTTTDRYFVSMGGAGSGKSVFSVQKVLFRVLTETDHRFLVVRKVAKTLRNSIFALFRDTISQWGLSQHFDITPSTLSITCKLNGNEIWFAGMDDPEKIKSITGITSILVEEASELKSEDFDQLDLRLRGYTKNYKQIILSFNPISILHWLKKRFFDVAQPNATVVHSTYKDNKFIDADYKAVLEGLKDKDPLYYDVYCLGKWGSLGQMVFSNYVVEDFDTDYQHFNNVYHGIDWGFNDPSAYIRVGLKDDNIYIIDELYETKKSNAELIKIVDSVHNKAYSITGDASEPSRIKEFQSQGYKIQAAKKGPGSVKAGIDFIRGRKVYIHPNCVNFLKEISHYQYKSDRHGNVTDEPIDAMNHLIDALRYSIESLAQHKAPLKAMKAIM